MLWQLATAAIVYSMGGQHRRAVFYNIPLCTRFDKNTHTYTHTHTHTHTERERESDERERQ